MRVIDVVQNTPEWEEARRGIPTVSEFSKIITPKKGTLSASADAYMAKLIDEIVRPDAVRGFAGNKHTERGHELEPKARAWYQFVTKANVQQVGFVVRDDGLAGCSPDAFVDDDGGVEIKAPDGPTHCTYLIKNELPDEYKAQVHGSLVITERKWWDFLSYCPGYKPFLIRVKPDDYTRKVAEALDQFVARLEEAKRQFIQQAA